MLWTLIEFFAFVYGLLSVVFGRFLISRKKVLTGREAQALGGLLMAMLPSAICITTMIYDLDAPISQVRLMATLSEIAIITVLGGAVLWLYARIPDPIQSDTQDKEA